MKFFRNVGVITLLTTTSIFNHNKNTLDSFSNVDNIEPDVKVIEIIKIKDETKVPLLDVQNIDEKYVPLKEVNSQEGKFEEIPKSQIIK